VPLSATRRQFTVMIDPRGATALRGGAARADALQDIYARALADLPELAARLRGAQQTTRPWGADASVYDAPTPCASAVLIVGDAASFIEPLSSAGVKKAMTSGWRAAVVANTCLAKPSMAPRALEYFAGREREISAECERAARGFFREAAAFHQTPFWSSRADAAPVPEPAGDAVRVRRAHERLRRAGHVRLRVSSALRFGTTPDVEGREIVLREAIVFPGEAAAERFAAGVNLPALVRAASAADDMAAIFSAYHAQAGPAPLDQIVTGLSVLVARDALVLEDACS
jgi:hypothetical protein